MLLKLQLLAAFLFSTCISYSQPVLTAAGNNPQPGDVVVSHYCDTTGITPGPGGAGVIWDFSSLIDTASDTTTYLSCDSISVLYPRSNLIARLPPSIGLGYTGFEYFVSTSDSLVTYSYYDYPNISRRYRDPLTIIKYPFSYLSLSTDSFGFKLISEEKILLGSDTTICDGYGTLKLPGVVFPNALRVYKKSIQRDTEWAFGGPGPQCYSSMMESYLWYVPGVHYPVCSIITRYDSGNIHPTFRKIVKFNNGYVVSSVPNARQLSAIKCYPNPVRDIVILDLPDAKWTNIKVIDIFGRTVPANQYETVNEADKVKLDLTKIPAGLYLIKVQTGNTALTQQITKL